MINLNKLLKLSAGEDGDQVHGISDIGKMRENNEDYFLVSQSKSEKAIKYLKELLEK